MPAASPWMDKMRGTILFIAKRSGNSEGVIVDEASFIEPVTNRADMMIAIIR
jgi:hypothetical protein